MIEPRCLIAPELRSTLFPDYFAADRKWFRGEPNMASCPG